MLAWPRVQHPSRWFWRLLQKSVGFNALKIFKNLPWVADLVKIEGWVVATDGVTLLVSVFTSALGQGVSGRAAARDL
jgi:hypothetical protein